jgi:hypothetical protein
MANDPIQIRARIAHLEAQRASIDAELAMLRKADKPPKPFRFLEGPDIPSIEDIPVLTGPVKHIRSRRRFDEGGRN